MSKQKNSAMLVFAAATTAGLLIAMTAAIVLDHYNIELYGIWRGLGASKEAHLRSALAWWAIAGIAFVAGFVIAFVMSRFEWLYLRWLRAPLALALTFGLAVAAGEAGSAHGIAAAAYVAANVAAMTAAGAMAAFGSYFALRR